MTLELPDGVAPAAPTPLVHGTFAVFMDERADLFLVLNSELTGAVQQKVPRMVVRQLMNRFPEARKLFGGE